MSTGFFALCLCCTTFTLTNLCSVFFHYQVNSNIFLSLKVIKITPFSMQKKVCLCYFKQLCLGLMNQPLPASHYIPVVSHSSVSVSSAVVLPGQSEEDLSLLVMVEASAVNRWIFLWGKQLQDDNLAAFYHRQTTFWKLIVAL